MSFFGIPGSLIYISKAFLVPTIDSVSQFKFIILAYRVINFCIAWKILFAYLGFWSDKREKIVFKNSNRMFAKGLVLTIVGFFVVFGGALVGVSTFSYVAMCDIVYPFSRSAISNYFIIMIGSGLFSVVVFQFLQPSFSTQKLGFDVFEICKKPFVKLFYLISKLFAFISSILYNYFDRMRRFVNLLLQKTAIGVFSSMYGADIVLCITVALMFFMFVYAIR